jgi:O-antigen/teichoic acid export membrane protein
VFALYNLVLDIILVPKWGLNGAAFATGTSMLFTYVYFLIATKFFIGVDITFPWKSVFKIGFNTLITAVFSYYVFSSHVTGLMTLLIALGLSGIIYLLISYFNRPFDETDRDYINRAFGRKLWVF